ncbi:unnamed protein product [Notodromas monacha]|uniref:Acetyl-coenzyme A transporter 1 n=1 Tax=Notodromas monacha TaxID=399045 RepID=A0A7R9BVV4_9CRUS|nr:unnamed protein product [Notodromas monacha]CAG0922692.1 unnamed protein product [Notodromas monacha]
MSESIDMTDFDSRSRQRKKSSPQERLLSESSDDHKSHHSWRDLKGDYGNIAVLYFLYVLQGIPIGLAGSVPMILQNRGVSYKEQAEYSFVNWPFSIKLLWAPIVDSVFCKRIGRRKTWLIPVQYLLGLAMMTYAYFVDEHLGEAPASHPKVGTLTMMFFGLNFLAATQDIAVDGWALTMLKRENVGFASTCNTAGQTTGYFLGSVVFMALESAEFCNSYIRSVPEPNGLLKLSDFLFIWGIIFLVTTTLVGILKHEKDGSELPAGEMHEEGVLDTYFTLWKILKLPIVRITAIFLLTSKIGFAATDAITGLKLIGKGVPKESLAMLAVPLVPLQIILPVMISKYTAGPKPMEVLLKAMPMRLMFGFVFAFVVWVTPWFEVSKGTFAWYYYALLLAVYMMHQVTLYSMYVALMAFFAKVSDPKVGGTYMTLMNTLTNLGGNWPATLMLWIVDNLTLKACMSPANGERIDPVTCYEPDANEQCLGLGGRCEVTLDGYYIETAICVVIGFLWLQGWGRRTAKTLQNLPLKSWKVR